ncbi:MAG: hypothetical protein CK424_02040 [Legionella sp.]|nr:MAG: hypothetical protein CK424_02040 [Legionella sp.]
MPKKSFKGLVKEKAESAERKLNRLLQSHALQDHYAIKRLQSGELVILENASNHLTSEIKDRFDELIRKLSLRNIIDYKKTRISSGANQFNGFMIEQIDYDKLSQYELMQQQKTSKPAHVNAHVWSRLEPEIKESWSELSRALQDHIITCYVKNINDRLAALPEGVQLGTASLQTPILYEIPSIPVYLPNPQNQDQRSKEFFDLMEILKLSKGEDPTTKIPFRFDEIIPATDKLMLIDQRLAAQEQKATPTVPAENLENKASSRPSMSSQEILKLREIFFKAYLSCESDSSRKENPSLKELSLEGRHLITMLQSKNPAFDIARQVNDYVSRVSNAVDKHQREQSLAPQKIVNPLDSKQALGQYSDICSNNPADSGRRKRFRQHLEGMNASTRAATLEFQSIDSLQKLSYAYSVLLKEPSLKDDKIQIQTMKALQKEISLSILIQGLSQQLSAFDPKFQITRNENEFIGIKININRVDAFSQYTYEKAQLWAINIQDGQITVYLDKEKMLKDPNVFENIKASLNAVDNQNIALGNGIKHKLNDNKNNFNVQSEEMDIILNMFKEKYGKNPEYKESIKNSDGSITLSFPSTKENGETMTDAERFKEVTSFFTEVAKTAKFVIMDKDRVNVLGYSNGDGNLYQPDGKELEKGKQLSSEAGIPLDKFDMSLMDEPARGLGMN